MIPVSARGAIWAPLRRGLLVILSVRRRGLLGALFALVIPALAGLGGSAAEASRATSTFAPSHLVPVEISTAAGIAGGIALVLALVGVGGSLITRRRTKRQRAASAPVTRESIEAAVKLREFGVHFQPVVELATGNVVGAEALVRWEPPGAEAKTARQFFSRAASAGVLDEVMAAALGPACDFARECLDGSPRAFQLHVNLSRSQVEAGSSIVETLQRALRESQLVPWALQVEITEQALMEAGPPSIATLKGLSELGLNIAVDDFWGQDETYWVLALPGVTAVKLDLRSNTNSEGTREQLANAARIAHARKLTVTGKRVESSFEVEFATEIGCDLVQGHAYGRPMTVEAFREFVVDRPASEPSTGIIAS